MSTQNLQSPNLSPTALSPKAWISVGVFLVLLVLVLVTREDRVSVGIRALALPALDEAQVEKIEVKGKAEALKGGAVLTKGEPGWTVAAPDKPDARFAADDTAVRALLDALGTLEAGGFVTARKEKHAELEIDDEKGLFVTFHQKGQPSLALVLGRHAQGGGNYLRLAGEDEVFIGKGRVASLLQKDVDAWRKKKLIDIPLAELASVSVEPAGAQSYTIEARTEGEGESAPVVWELAANVTRPDGFLTDAELARRLAQAAVGLRASAFLDEQKGTNETGLGDPVALGRLVLKSKDGQTVTVRLGKEDDSQRVHAQLEGDGQIYLLPAHQAKNVMKTLAELRDLTLARFESSVVERVAIQGAEGTMELLRKEGRWSLSRPLTKPDGFELDPARVDGLLASLTRLKGSERFEAPPAGHGTDRPTTSVTLTLADGATKTIAFGRPVPGDEGGKRVYVQGAEEPAVFAIAEHQKTRLEKPLDLVKKLPPPEMPPGGMGGMGGGMQGLESLPPEVRRQLEESLRQQGLH